MLYAVEGELTEPDVLETDGAQQVRDAINRFPSVELIETRVRTVNGYTEDVLVIDVEPELPQVLDHDIRSPERLAVAFRKGELGWPKVTALRVDFPSVPHLNWTQPGEPRSLCLYEDAWSEVRLRWTGAGFLRHVVYWLSKTAVGELHMDDQPLEPFLFESLDSIIFPEEVFDIEAKEKIFVATTAKEHSVGPIALKLQNIDGSTPQDAVRMYCAALVAKPLSQQAMRDCPGNVNELSLLLKEIGIDLWDELQSRLELWYFGSERFRADDILILVIKLPRLRSTAEKVDSFQYLAFGLQPMEDVAKASGRFDVEPSSGKLVPLIGSEVNEDLAGVIGVDSMRPIQCLDSDMARRISGLAKTEHKQRVVLVGAGALGSQIHNNLSRMGWGHWTLVDNDTLWPHNVTRHRLGDNAVGLPKIEALDTTCNIEVPHNKVDKSIFANAMNSKTNTDLASAYTSADLILDVSTSIAVQRFLAQDLDASARRVSLFVNLTGRDAVMLMEDVDRSVTLDALEAQYFRAVLSDNRLDGHITRVRGYRYGNGCRDVATRLAQDDLSLASGLLSRQIRTCDSNPAAVVWRMKNNGSVERIEIEVSEVVLCETETWRVHLDRCVIDRAANFRQDRLPKETGGVLIGYFDMPRRTVYVVDVLPAPKDSMEQETAFIRGYAGLQDNLAVIEEKSGGQVSYVGEWHSHPKGTGIGMSDDDTDLLKTIAGEMRMEGWPGVVMIVGDHGNYGLYIQD